MGNFSAVMRFMLFIAGTLVLLVPHLVVRAVTGNLGMTRAWHRFACFCFGIRARYNGTPRQPNPDKSTARPVIFLCNHISYLDIIVLGAGLDAIFVAKSEVASWPAFGFLSKTQNTIFIPRKRAALEASKKAIADVLHQGRNIILFGEGTSTDGRTVLPFKPGLLDILFDGGAAADIQPVAITIESINGKPPLDQPTRDTYAWWRPEDTLAPHLWNFAKSGGAVIAVDFLPPLTPSDFPDRKALATRAHDGVAAILAAAQPALPAA